jgi:hypothetical protein
VQFRVPSTAAPLATLRKTSLLVTGKGWCRFTLSTRPSVDHLLSNQIWIGTSGEGRYRSVDDGAAAGLKFHYPSGAD